MGVCDGGCWVLSLLLVISVCSAAPCPCSDPALCQPITETRDPEVYVFHVRDRNWIHYDWSMVTTVALFAPYDPELMCYAHAKGARLVLTGKYASLVYVFHVRDRNWIHYDWSMVTTVALFAPYDPELMCYAHAKGARLVLTGDVQLDNIVDPQKRSAWVSQKVNLAKSQYLDGINLDIEQSVLPYSAEYYALTALVQETTDAFHREIPGSQVTFDVAWSPNCVALRCYNYTAIADLCDFLFVMSYDDQSQIWIKSIAGANASFNDTITGYIQFINLGVNPKKLVMGLPWYGYDYSCVQLTETNQCKLHKQALRRPDYNAAVGDQVGYSTIMKQLNSSMSGRLWDDEQKAAFYNYKGSQGKIHQVWYDDPESITLKAAYIKKLGLRGIGMWHGDLLDYSNDPIAQQQTKDMWEALLP